MRNASGHQFKVKMSGSEKKVKKKTYDISFIKRVTKKFLEVSRCSRAKQRQRSIIGRTGYSVFLRRNLISVRRNTLTR